MKMTPLHSWHVDNGANMAEFGSYSMPLWYPQGAKQEHIGVIQSAGLFDTSHMAAVIVKGANAHDLLQAAFTKDLDRCVGPAKKELSPGRSVYGLFLKENGHVIDDAIVSMVDDSLYMVVVNAGMGKGISDYLQSFHEYSDVEISDQTDRLGKIDIQGPASAKILSKILDSPAAVFDNMIYFSFKGWFDSSLGSKVVLKDGTPVLLSRTGYTGEFGFELFLDSEHLVRIWQELLLVGDKEIVPCGLAARDSLRAGAVLPLSHQDIGEWPFANNPWPFALPLNDDNTFTKSFVGAVALRSNDSDNYTYSFAGFDPRKITVGEDAAVLDKDGAELGTILTCTTDMAISRVGEKIVSLATSTADGKPEDFKPRGLSCGFVKISRRMNSGEKIYLYDGRRKIEVEIREDVRPDRTARLPIKTML